VGGGWTPTVETYLPGQVTKARIMQAERIGHLKKGEMATQAEVFAGRFQLAARAAP
jgi:hypothetical protein